MQILDIDQSDHGLYLNTSLTVFETAQDNVPEAVFDPQYGGYDFPGRDELTDGGSPPERYGNDIQAFYVDWQLKPSEQLKLLAGLRLDRTKGYYRSIDRSVNYGAADSRGTSPRVGFVYTPIPALDVFANYSSSFTPNLFLDGAGRAIDTPEKSRQIEGGLRYDFIPERLRGSLAVFSIVKENVLVPDPADPTGQRSVLNGEQASDGFELELAGNPTPAWSLLFGYSYYDARVTEATDPATDANPDNDGDASEEGLALVDAPKNHVTAYSRYDFASGFLRGAWLSYSLIWVDDRRSSFSNPGFDLPSYAQHDMGAGYTLGRWAFQLNATNLSDERIYFTHGNNIHLQPPVNVQASVGLSF